MPKYQFDVQMFAIIDITADNEKSATEKIKRYIDGSSANLGCDDEKDPIIADLAFESADLIEIDGEPV